MKKIAVIFALGFIFWIYACGSGDGSPKPSEMNRQKAEEPKADDGRGVGEIKHVDLNDPLDETLIARGQEIFDMKCAACHKTTGQRVVGPGFAGLTERRKPEWIMNMILNVEVMLEEDPAAQALLKECLVRMPNQNLSKEDARAILEFAYANDSKTSEN